MSNVLNLLPEERVRLRRHAYRVRVANVSLVLLSVCVVLGGTFLLPSQMQTRSAYDAAVRELAQLGLSPDQATAASGTQEVTGGSILETLQTAELASPFLRELTSVPREGIIITKFEYSLQGVPQRVQVSGKARTREQLAAFVKNLQALPKVATVQLPVSAYAKESDLPFTLTLTLKS